MPLFFNMDHVFLLLEVPMCKNRVQEVLTCWSVNITFITHCDSNLADMIPNVRFGDAIFQHVGDSTFTLDDAVCVCGSMLYLGCPH